MKRALISVSNKTGVIEFAKGLQEMGMEIISTGGTAKALQAAGVKILQISEVTHFPEMMDGRVKTLHPRVHGGILARRSNPEDLKEITAQGIQPIDLVVVNLYPFAETIAKGNVDLDEALENIDIGGPSMIRAAAKNFKDVAIVVDQNDYAGILMEMSNSNGELSFATRRRLAAKAFNHTANYDAMIDQYFCELLRGEVDESNCGCGCGYHSSGQPASQVAIQTLNTNVAHCVDQSCTQTASQSSNTAESATINVNSMSTSKAIFPERLQIRLEKVMDLRYGENPHQEAAFYKEMGAAKINSVSTAKQLHGKELSFNNINDANGAVELVREFTEPAAVVIKHANPCGAAIGATLAEAYEKAYEGDPRSAYGSIVAVNRPVDKATAEIMTSGDKFIEVLLAPSYNPDALVLLQERWKNIRILEMGELQTYPELSNNMPLWDVKRVMGGYLVQDLDREDLDAAAMKVMSATQPTEQQMIDLRFAWKVAKHVKSNAIVLAKDGMVVGVGAGQMSRVDSMEIAISKAGERVKGSVVASDAFFPFRDSIDRAAEAGIAAIIEPGGSIRDEDVITACNEHGLAMMFTGMRHFKH